MATFTGQAGTNNIFTGTAAADLFLWAALDLNSLDRATGGTGADVLRLTTSGALASTALGGIAGIERFVLAAGGNGLTLANSNFAGVAGAVIVVTGGAGADSVNGSALTGANRIDVTAGAGAGADVLRGGAGADVFRFAAADLAGDTVAGGLGKDLLLLTTGGLLGTGGVTGTAGVERFVLSAVGNTLTLANGNFAGVAGAAIVVTGGAGADTISGSALTGANRIDVTAGAGADVLRGGAGADVFRFVAADLAGDTVAGGLGKDKLVLTTSGLLGTGGVNAVAGIEQFFLAAGGNTLALVNANFTGVAGAAIVVTGSTGADIVSGAALTGANRIDVTAGIDANNLTGGAGRDVFRFRAAELTSADTVQGGAGFDLLLLTSNGPLGTGGLNSVAGVERLVLAAGGNTLSLVNGNFAGVAGAAIVVSGSAGADTVNAAALTGSNRIDVTAGAGADTLTGGAGRDIFRFRSADLTSTDIVTGGAGLDLLLLTTTGTVAGLNGMSAVETIELAATGNTITLQNANFAGVAGARIVVKGGNGADTVDGSALTGANAIDVTAGAGASADVLRGGAGNDVFRFAKAELDGDIVAGGGGADTLLLTTVGGLGGTALAHVTGVETIRFAAGGNALALVDANFAGVAGGVITVIGGGGPNLVDAAQLTGSNSIAVTAGKDFDSLTGGEGNDVFRFDRLYLTADDTVSGGDGYDTLQLLSGGTLAFDALANMTGVEGIILAAEGNGLILTDANFAVRLAEVSNQIVIQSSAGSNVIDAADLTTGRINVADGGGIDTITGGTGTDTLRFVGGNAFRTGDSFDGGDGIDRIIFDRSMNFLGNTITNVEQLLLFGGASVAVTISGENAAQFSEVGSLSGPDSNTQTYTVQLSAGSTTDLSKLTLLNADAGDAINVVATGGSTSVTLSSSIASFTGSADADRVSFAPGGGVQPHSGD